MLFTLLKLKVLLTVSTRPSLGGIKGSDVGSTLSTYYDSYALSDILHLLSSDECDRLDQIGYFMSQINRCVFQK